MPEPAPMDGPDGNMPEGPMPQEDPMGMPPADDGQSEFDTNFNAGVEADEDTDPKKFIQQLTGKLSQTLSAYNNENGGSDTETNKYVANMLVAQVAKNLDDSDKKEVIKKINTAVGPEGNEEQSEEEPIDAPEDEGGEDPIMENVVHVINKRQIKEALNDEIFADTSNDKVSPKRKNKKPSPFDGKKID